jgi:hypothetical protein
MYRKIVLDRITTLWQIRITNKETAMNIDDKVLRLCQLAIEAASSDDASIDGDRDAELLEFQRGAEVVSPAHLSSYDTRGDAPPTLARVIQTCYNMQNDEWKRQYPDRANLWDSYEDTNCEIAQEAEEWLHAALDDEWAYLQIEVTYDETTVKWKSRFTNEINTPLGHIGEGEIDRDEFEALDDDCLERLAEKIAEAAYDYGK